MTAEGAADAHRLRLRYGHEVHSVAAPGQRIRVTARGIMRLRCWSGYVAGAQRSPTRVSIRFATSRVRRLKGGGLRNLTLDVAQYWRQLRSSAHGPRATHRIGHDLVQALADQPRGLVDLRH